MAAKPMPVDHSVWGGPCHTSTIDGTTYCPYVDDEPGEYTENFYSNDWGSAGQFNVSIIGGNDTRYWDSHVVYKLDQEAADSGQHDIMIQDHRSKGKKLPVDSWIKTVEGITNLNIDKGECSTKPEANCITIVDFDKSKYEDPNVGGYMSPQGLYDRTIAINTDLVDNKKIQTVFYHEAGHALGLSHKHATDGVMSYHLVDSTYSDDEIAALQLAYGKPGATDGTTDTPTKPVKSNKGKGNNK